MGHRNFYFEKIDGPPARGLPTTRPPIPLGGTSREPIQLARHPISLSLGDDVTRSLGTRGKKDQAPIRFNSALALTGAESATASDLSDPPVAVAAHFWSALGRSPFIPADAKPLFPPLNLLQAMKDVLCVVFGLGLLALLMAAIPLAILVFILVGA